ncbi:hypothetical protein MKZ38_008693 [Zalerion maritima]|uniref:Postreplication repair E3 ubiquitin-protein ligase RAD18 n=1 Tax=Zalerion maritima TaxID=339359 RepID=A0AAD5RHR1_9PEZI|nr:hypothetical protein MKZ38_008693 [Zalerion maritima]
MCRSSQQESKLRSSVPLAEAVDAFVNTRSAVLDLATQPPPPPDISPPAKRIPTTSPKRKIRELAGPNNKRLRTSMRISKLREGSEVTATMAQIEVDGLLDDHGRQTGKEEDDDEIFVPGMLAPPIAFSSTIANIYPHLPDDGLVECPICLQRMKEVTVSRHLDTTCPGEPQTSRAPPKAAPLPTTTLPVFGSMSEQSPKPMECLPAVNYNMLKEQALRKKLSELGIPSHGPRQIVEKRHKEWMTIWNANCDSSHPKKRSELLRALDTWERTQGTLAPVSSKAIITASKIKDKDFDAAAWSEKHSGDFKDLIASARQSREKAKQKQVAGPVTNSSSMETAKEVDTSPVPSDLSARPDEAHIANALETYAVYVPRHSLQKPVRPFRGDGFAPSSSQTGTESSAVFSDGAPVSTSSSL